MDNMDYIDWDEREFPDASSSAAVHECANCGRTADRLTLVPEFNYMGCDDCMEEALEIIAADAIEAACLADRKAIAAARAAAVITLPEVA